MNRTDSVTNIVMTAGLPARRMTHRMVACVFHWMSACVVLCALSATSTAQPPGTYPPAELVRPPSSPSEPNKLQIQGFLFLDVNGNVVLEPGMTYERLQELKSGSNGKTRKYAFKGVKINGRVEGNRAELTVEVEVDIDASGNETVRIPLAMENFHLVGPTEFFSGTGNGNKLAITVNEDTGENELIASVKSATVVGFRMQMSARVETESIRSLDFRLPPSPVVINLTSDSRDVEGQIPNRDDEVISTTIEPGTKRSQFRIESSGGRFTLQWGKLDRAIPKPLLVVTSGVSMQWNSPQDPLIQNVEMTVRDTRGPISSFKLRLPKNATMRDNPRLVTSGQFGPTVEFSKIDSPDSELFLVTIPKAERRPSIVLEFSVEIPSSSPSQDKPLEFEVPVIEDALRNQGTINVSTGADYRLRWRQRPYINNTSGAAADDVPVDRRVYSFQFIRGEFKLPLWLDVTKRELRVSSECDIELRDNYANLAMEIRSVGNGNRAQLLSVDLADWQAPQIENARTGAPLPWYESEDVIEIEVNYTGMEESIPVLIKARRRIDSQSESDPEPRVNLPIPRVVGSGDRRDPVTIQEALVRLTEKGRRSLVVDLDRSTNLERSSLDDNEMPDSVRQFEVVPPESDARMVGEMVIQQPRISLESTSEVKLKGDQVVTAVNWQIETPVDLEGKLRIAVPGDAAFYATDDSNSATDTSLRWSVYVNDVEAALLEAVDDDLMTMSTTVAVPEDESESAIAGEDARGSASGVVHFDLISDALTDGAMQIRFIRSTPIEFDADSSEAFAEIGLPYPLVQDITLRGAVSIQLEGDETHDITAAKKSLSDQLLFRTLPRETIPLRITPRTPEQSDLLTGKILVRSAVNEISQHDQLIANLIGTGEFELQLRYPDRTEIQVSLNGRPAAFKTIDDRLVVRVPADQLQQIVDVRLWVDQTSQDLFPVIAPLAHVGPGSGQLFWQLTVPSDNHLVWAAPSVSRAMQWVFDRWRMRRRPVMTETALVTRVVPVDPETIDLSPMPMGNRYLFSSTDDRAFLTRMGSRTILWMIVAGAIVFVTTVLTYLPATRNPVSLALGVAAFSGLLAVAPDAAILVGQVAMLAMALVIVMLAIRSLVLPAPSRVLTSSRESRLDSSTQSRRQPVEYRPPSSIAVTHSIGPEDVSSAPDEVAS